MFVSSRHTQEIKSSAMQLLQYYFVNSVWPCLTLSGPASSILVSSMFTWPTLNTFISSLLHFSLHWCRIDLRLMFFECMVYISCSEYVNKGINRKNISIKPEILIQTFKKNADVEG